MIKKRPKQLDVSSPQTVTDLINVFDGQKTIKIGFTDQKISPRAGLSPLGGFVQHLGWKRKLQEVLPQRSSPNGTGAGDVALSFMASIWCGAKKLAHVAVLRGDPVLSAILGIEQVVSQSALSRYFARFTSAWQNNACFGPLWQWCLQRLPSWPGGYTLDLDTTRLLHEDAHGKQGVRTGYTPKGCRRCYHPMLAVLAEAKLVVGFWLRPGNTRCDNNVVAFTLDLLGRLPSFVRIGLVRADSGFCDELWLALLEARRLCYVVVGRIHEPLRQLIRQSTRWTATDLPGTEVADEVFECWGWSRRRRVILIRHRVQERPDAGGKSLLHCPGYRFQLLVTNLPDTVPALEVWRRYNGRAGSENVIKELDASFALPQLCLEGFYATEAAMSLAVLSYNLCILFQRHLGWQDRVNAATLRFRVFTTAGVVSCAGGYTTLRLALPRGQLRQWWARLLEKLSSPFPNCVAVENHPPNPGLL